MEVRKPFCSSISEQTKQTQSASSPGPILAYSLNKRNKHKRDKTPAAHRCPGGRTTTRRTADVATWDLADRKARSRQLLLLVGGGGGGGEEGEAAARGRWPWMERHGETPQAAALLGRRGWWGRRQRREGVRGEEATVTAGKRRFGGRGRQPGDLGEPAPTLESTWQDLGRRCSRFSGENRYAYRFRVV